MHYFGKDLIAYRGNTGTPHVFDAYCEHLGAHLGYGGTVTGDDIVCPFHGWQWNSDGKNVHIPYQDRPNRARRIRVWPVQELNESIYIWHDGQGRPPQYDVPDIFELFDDDVSPDDFYRSYPEGTLCRRRLSVHPQYVIENGVDFAHFKFVHRADRIPMFTRMELDNWCFYADFDMRFRPSKSSAVAGTDALVHGGLQACNVGVSLGFSRSWGVNSVRTLTGITPVDEHTSDIRLTTWLPRLAGDDAAAIPEKFDRQIRISNNQFLADVNIWEHQRYTEPPGLATAEAKGFRSVRRWARRFYPPGELGSGDAEQDAGLDTEDLDASDTTEHL
jgi:nitrite reductase/ring-hydroxylating ferredoxin subunit